MILEADFFLDFCGLYLNIHMYKDEHRTARLSDGTAHCSLCLWCYLLKNLMGRLKAQNNPSTKEF